MDVSHVEVENTKEWKVGNVFDYTVLDAIEEEQLDEVLCEKSENLETLRFGWTIEDFDRMRKEMAAKGGEPDEQRLRSQAYEFGKMPFKWRLLLYPNGNPTVNYNPLAPPHSHLSVYAEVIYDPPASNSPGPGSGTKAEGGNEKKDGLGLGLGDHVVKSPDRGSRKDEDTWSIHCKVDIVLLNCIKGKKHHHESCEYRFRSSMSDRGFASFADLNLVTKAEGFLDPAGKLHLECRVRRCSELASLSLRSQDAKKLTGMWKLGLWFG